MNKLLISCSILFLLFFNQANADVNAFNKWLFENGHTEYVKKDETEICKNLKKNEKITFI